MNGEPLDLKRQGRYIGSLQKDGQLCDFYELVIDGQTQYIYVPAEEPQNKSEG